MSTYELPLGKKKKHQPNKPATKPNHPPSPPLFPERLPQVISGLVSSRTSSKTKFQCGNSCCKVWAMLAPWGRLGNGSELSDLSLHPSPEYSESC